jgi:ubiquinone/menaquinone biosynthesis C-methylase UbiE
MSDRKMVSREYYDKLAPQYDKHSHSSYLSKLSPCILTRARDWGCQSVLDVGCGTGSLLALLKDSGINVAGADISPNMIQEAKKLLGEQVDLRVADSENLPWQDMSFSLVVCVGSFHHYPSPQKALSEMRRVLYVNGHLIIADPTLPIFLRQLANLFIGFSGEGATKMYSQSELWAMISNAGFDNIERIDINSKAIVLGASVSKSHPF